MSDDEMRQLGVPALQDDGLIFLWVTGRAMELGRECLKLWGYEVNLLLPSKITRKRKQIFNSTIFALFLRDSMNLFG